MRLSAFGLILVLLLILSIQISQAQFWGQWGIDRCYGQFEQYSECASTCPDTCDDIRRPNPFKICDLICRRGCECIRPFIRFDKNPFSPCVHPFQCRFI
jgi:hypothetical protein